MSVKIPKTIFLLTCGLAMIYACNSSQSSSESKSNKAESTENNKASESGSQIYSNWKMIELTNMNLDKIDNQTTPDLTIEKDSGSAFGTAGCNTFRGKVDVLSGGKISFVNMVSTKKTCPDMGLERRYLTLLKRVDSYEINGDTLLLHSVEDSRFNGRFVEKK